MDGIHLEFILNSRETCDCKMQTAGTYYQFAKVHSVILCMIRGCHLWIDAICEAFARMKLLFFLSCITIIHINIDMCRHVSIVLTCIDCTDGNRVE